MISLKGFKTRFENSQLLTRGHPEIFFKFGEGPFEDAAGIRELKKRESDLRNLQLRKGFTLT